MLTQRSSHNYEITYTTIMGCVAARIATHETDTKVTNYLGSAQSSHGTMDVRMHRWTGEGLMHAHLEEAGLEARPLTLKLTTDSGYQMESFMSPKMLKMVSG